MSKLNRRVKEAMTGSGLTADDIQNICGFRLEPQGLTANQLAELAELLGISACWFATSEPFPVEHIRSVDKFDLSRLRRFWFSGRPEEDEQPNKTAL